MTAPPAGHMTPIGGSAAGRARYDRATALELDKLRSLKFPPGRSEALRQARGAYATAWGRLARDGGG